MSRPRTLRIIAGEVGGRRIKLPPGQDLRPMMEKVRAALFDMLWHLDALQGRGLDLYAGSGAVGLEALSRGIERMEFVEANPVSARTIDDNLKQLDFEERGRVHRRRVEEVIARPAMLGDVRPFNLISVTPPYYEADYPDLVGRLAASSLVGAGSAVVVEHPRQVRLDEQIGTLERVRERRYGSTMLSIYLVPLDDEGDGTF